MYIEAFKQHLTWAIDKQFWFIGNRYTTKELKNKTVLSFKH